MTINALSEDLRNNLTHNAKNFKTSWIFLGQALYTVWRDKLFHAWGHEKFEDYVVNELGMKNTLAMKLVKTYFFVEQQEPEYLQKEFAEGREAAVIPSYEPLDVLRLARKEKDLTREDYQKLREQVFVKGKDAVEVKKELTAMIKERKQVDPDVEREKRNKASIARMISCLKLFVGDMNLFKLCDHSITEASEDLLNKLQEDYS